MCAELPETAEVVDPSILSLSLSQLNLDPVGSARRPDQSRVGVHFTIILSLLAKPVSDRLEM